MDQETDRIRKFFRDLHINVSDIWLQSCIEWCKEENLPPNFTFKQLQTEVYEQWLLLDLRDLEVACLPPDLGKQQRYVLHGNYSLQIMQIVDISKPKLWQLQKIRNANALTREADDDESNHGKRVLQLTLTDGLQEVEAMEYRPVPELSLSVRPGAKVRLQGPVNVRRGRIMLERHNIRLLGGEAEELLVSNAAENVLAKCLNLPLNSHPMVVEDDIVKEEPTVTPIAIKEEEFSVPSTSTEPFERRLDERKIEPSLKKHIPMFDDLDFKPKDFEVMDEIIASTEAHTSSSAAPSTSFDDDDDAAFDDILDAHLDNLDREMVDPLSDQHRITAISITKLLEHKRSINKGVFKIRAKFKSVVEKLTVDEEAGYKLVIKIDDGTDELVVRVHSDVSAQLSGYTPEALMGVKEGIKIQDSESIQLFLKVMQGFKEKLMELDGILAVQVSRDEELPVLTKIVTSESTGSSPRSSSPPAAFEPGNDPISHTSDSESEARTSGSNWSLDAADFPGSCSSSDSDSSSSVLRTSLRRKSETAKSTEMRTAPRRKSEAVKSTKVKRTLFPAETGDLTDSRSQSIASVEVGKPCTATNGVFPAEDRNVLAMITEPETNSYDMTVEKTLHANTYQLDFVCSDVGDRDLHTGRGKMRPIAFVISSLLPSMHKCRLPKQNVASAVMTKHVSTSESSAQLRVSHCIPVGLFNGAALELNDQLVVPFLPRVTQTETQSKDDKTKRHACIFCGKHVTSIARHILSIHKNEENVRAINLLPPNSKERRILLDKLRLTGNSTFNASAAPQLRIPVKRPHKTQISAMVPCPSCDGLFAKRTLYRHEIKCTGRAKGQRKAVLREALAIERRKSGALKSLKADTLELLSGLNNDAISDLVKEDPVILLMAERCAMKHRGDLQHFRNNRQLLRLAGKMLLRAKERDRSIDGWYDLLRNERYRLILDVIEQDILNYDQKSRSYLSPSYANLIRHVLSKLDVAAGTNMSGVYNNKDQAYKDLYQFRFPCDDEYKNRISKTIRKTMKRKKKRTIVELPTAEDINTLTRFLNETAKKNYDDITKDGHSFAAWYTLNAALLLLLLIFNRRRPTEVAMMRLADYKLKRGVTNQDKKTMNRLDIMTADTYVCVQILGKRDRKLPILIKKRDLQYIDKLIELRSAAGVAAKNPFVFANTTADGYFQLASVLRRFASLCPGLKFPERLLCTVLRNEVATQAQYLNLSMAELQMVADAMGHDLAVHMEIYRQPEMHTEILDVVAKYFQFVGDMNLSDHKGKTIDELKRIVAEENDRRKKDATFDLQDDDDDEMDDNNSDIDDNVVPADAIFSTDDVVSLGDISDTGISDHETNSEVALTRIDSSRRVQRSPRRVHPSSIKVERSPRKVRQSPKKCRMCPISTASAGNSKETRLKILETLFAPPRGKGRRPQVFYDKNQRELILHRFKDRLLKGIVPTPTIIQDFIEDNLDTFRSTAARDHQKMYSFLQFRRNQLKKKIQELKNNMKEQIQDSKC